MSGQLYMVCFSLVLIVASSGVFANVQPAANRKSVVVIGAGVSGLAAARTLANSGQWDVTVFEGRKDRYGGRVWTDRTSFDRIRGVEADLGVVLVDIKDPENELSKLFGSFEVTPRSIRSSQLIDGANNKIYNGPEFDNLTQIYQQVVTAALQVANLSKKDMSLQEAIDQLYLQDPKLEGKLPTNLIETMTLVKHNLAASRLSSRALKFRLDMSPDTIIEEGFLEVVDRLVSGVRMDEGPLNLELNKIVRQIKIVPPSRAARTGKVLVRTTDRLQKEVDAVVVAVPLGVLTKGEFLFEPKLSPMKRKALNSMGVGTVNNLVFEFNARFWPKDIDIFHFVAPQRDQVGVMTTWLNTGSLSGRRESYLTTFIHGDAVEVFENNTDTQLKTIALERLRAMFGLTSLSLLNIVTMKSSKWHSDPFSRGFFSYPVIGSPADQWDVISEPMCPHLFFAGEYTDSTRYGTVQGAFKSGLKAARDIMYGCQEKPKSPSPAETKESKPPAIDKKDGSKISVSKDTHQDKTSFKADTIKSEIRAENQTKKRDEL